MVKMFQFALDVAANELIRKNRYSIHSKKFISIDQSIKKYQKDNK